MVLPNPSSIADSFLLRPRPAVPVQCFYINTGEKVRQMLQFADRLCHRKLPYSFGRHIDSRRCRQDYEQKDHCQRGSRQAPHSIGEMSGDQNLVKQPVKRHTRGTADSAAAESIGKGFGCNHFCHLISVHTHCPHGAVLPDPCRCAHGNTIDNIQHRNQCDNCQKSIDTAHKRCISACGTLLPQILKFQTVSRCPADGFHLFLRSISDRLYFFAKIS